MGVYGLVTFRSAFGKDLTFGIVFPQFSSGEIVLLEGFFLVLLLVGVRRVLECFRLSVHWVSVPVSLDIDVLLWCIRWSW